LIEIIGEAGTSEYEAAVSIGKAIAQLWPGSDTSLASKDQIKIAASVKISGYAVGDIDVVVFGNLARPRKFIPNRLVKDTDGKRVVKQPIVVKNFIITVEVKDNDESRMRLSGDNVDVKYVRGATSGWKSATEQNIKQLHSLKDYLKDLGFEAFVYRCVLLRGVSFSHKPGIVTAGFEGADLFTSIARVSPVRTVNGSYTLSSFNGPAGSRVAEAPIFRKIIPTALDRTKMDAIVRLAPESEELLADLGNLMVRLRGRGGSGKTIMLLQAAWKAFELEGKRSIVLTYNHALAADIRRLLALLHVPADPDGGGVAVETVMSFMCRWFNRLQIVDAEQEFSELQYKENCQAALNLLSGGAIQQEDIDSIIASEPDQYDFDCLIVDEAQDWPQVEAELLKALYGPSKISLADGIDQLVRGKRTQWDAGVAADEFKTISLSQCLRMKRNLAAFANKVADLAGINWDILPNDVAGGGRVIILRRSYFDYPQLHDELVASAKATGNSPLDFLFVVPSTDVHEVMQKRVSDAGTALASLGCEVWDGVNPTTRKDFPRSSDQFRVVQYASCRGLEGWTVVLQNADKYWQEQHYWRENEGLSDAEEAAFEKIDDIASRDAWYRLLIGLTRPIDTLVISLVDQQSECTGALLAAANELSDFVEILD
jgi:hypothetical protein